MKILLIGYETEGYALAKLGKYIERKEHRTLLAQADYYSFIDDESIRGFFSEIGYENWEIFSEEYTYLYQKDQSVDWNYLSKFEEDYCVNKNIQQLLMTDPVVARHHHFRRPYYAPESPDSTLVYFWIERMLKWTEELITDFDPDVIFAPSRTYFVKNAAAQIAMATDRKMLTHVRSRIGEYGHLVNNFGLGTSKPIREYIKKNSTARDSKFYTQAKQIVEQFQGSNDYTGLYDAIAQQRVQSEQLYTTGEVLKNYIGNCRQLLKKSLKREKKKYRGPLKANLFNSYFPYVFKFRTRTTYGRLKYIYSDPFCNDLPDQPFIYVPLHTLPESSTLTLSTEYYEDDLIRHIAKELPAAYYLAVKENPNMIGIRPYEYYDDLRDIPNVKLIDPAVPSKRLIRQSRGVVGVSGTALLEAAILDKPTHCFGYPEFDAVIDYYGYSELSCFVEACKSEQGAIKPERTIRYIQYIIENGTKMPVDTVRVSPTNDGFEKLVETFYNMLSERVDDL